MKTRLILTLALLFTSAPYLMSQLSFPLQSNSHPGYPVKESHKGYILSFHSEHSSLSRFIDGEIPALKGDGEMKLTEYVTRHNTKTLDNSYIKNNYFDEPQKKKSIWLAAGLSALLPGAGEFYGKSYLKAAIFLGVEVISWGAFAYFRVKGDNKTDDFEKYANSNWDVKRYGQWLRDQGFRGASVIDTSRDLETLRAQINQCESQNFSHTLPEYNTQQYYEVIGKYQNFVAGWADAGGITQGNYETYHTQMYDFYANERQKANDYYDYATTGAIIVILNHLLSAADAAWTVSMYNKKIKMETGFEIKRYRSPFTQRVGNLPSFNLKVSF